MPVPSLLPRRVSLADQVAGRAAEADAGGADAGRCQQAAPCQLGHRRLSGGLRPGSRPGAAWRPRAGCAARRRRRSGQST